MSRVIDTARAEVYLAEYSQPRVIAFYLPGTAATGIGNIVKNVYRPIYQKIIKTILSQRPNQYEFRILEYGCGGGMNLLELIDLIHAEGAHVASAIGTDFSAPMLEAARGEAARSLSAEQNSTVTYLAASHGMLTQDIAASLRMQPQELHNTLDLVLGVNTFRYAYRLKQAKICARELFGLLRPGGYSIMIDMNRSVRFKGSRAYDCLTRSKQQYYVPNLREYSTPFQEAGFSIEEVRRFFCFTRLDCAWLPFQLRTLVLSLCRRLRPTFDLYLSFLAQHTLVIAKKPL